MKKLMTLLLMLALALSLSGTAFAEEVKRSSQRMTLDGKEITLDAWNIDGYNFVRLRDLAAALSGTDSQFSVDYDAETNTILIETGKPYTAEEEVRDRPVGHLEGIPKRGTQNLEVDGAPVTDLQIWGILGSTYFQLAELQPFLGFGLDYDADSRTVRITGTGVNPAKLPEGANSYEEIFDRLSSYNHYAYGEMPMVDYEAGMPLPAPDFEVREEATAAPAGAAAPEHSGTNVQVEGIDEGDIVKTDGIYIYALDDDELTIIKADGPDSKVISTLELDDFEVGRTDADKHPQEMFIADGKLVVISNAYEGGDYWIDGYRSYWGWRRDTFCCVDFFDVTDPTHPRLTGSTGQSGTLLSSRMKDGRVYVVTGYDIWSYDCVKEEPRTYIPCVYTDGKLNTIPADCIYLCGSGDRYIVAGDYTVTDGKLKEYSSLLGDGEEVYMSYDNLYVLGSEYDSRKSGTWRESVYEVTEYRDGYQTDIYRFDLNGGGLKLAATGKIPGEIESQFSADESDGYLRVVTTRDDYRYREYADKRYGFRNTRYLDSPSTTGLYILDKSLDVVGSLTGLAEDEYVYSVRFDGDVAYFCTYRSIDPLFAADLSDPTAPKVLSALKITGFSEYLHKWTEGRLLGFGKEADENGRTEGLKLVMFDTTDKTDVRALKTLNLPDVSYSEALYNHKAFFIIPEKNIIGFCGDGTYYVYSYDDAQGFRERSSFQFDGWEYEARGLYIEDWAYIVGSEQLLVIDMNRWGKPSVIQWDE